MLHLLVDLISALIYSVASFVMAGTGVATLVCAVSGGALRWHFDRESARFLGGIAVGLILFVDSIVLGIVLCYEPAGVDDPMPRYYVVMVPLVAWLVHLPIGLGVLRLGIWALEMVATQIAQRRGGTPDLPT